MLTFDTIEITRFDLITFHFDRHERRKKNSLRKKVCQFTQSDSVSSIGLSRVMRIKSPLASIAQSLSTRFFFLSISLASSVFMPEIIESTSMSMSSAMNAMLSGRVSNATTFSCRFVVFFFFQIRVCFTVALPF